jgi:CO/xanthine dehydrogenase Mo-binding subunit
MRAQLEHKTSRREFIRGVLVVGIGLGLPKAALAGAGSTGSGYNLSVMLVTGDAERESVPPQDQINAWLAMDNKGRVTLFSGKVELGTGVQTAFSQITAEELNVPVGVVSVIMGDTSQTPDQGVTAGSNSIQEGGIEVRVAAAAAKQVLLQAASARLGVPIEQLVVVDGVVSEVGNPSNQITYGKLISNALEDGEELFSQVIPATVVPESPSDHTVVGTSAPRVDLPQKLTGEYQYASDVRLANMLHGRVVRPAGIGATLTSIDESSLAGLAGHPRVVRNGNFVGVVADGEWSAIVGSRTLAVTWELADSLPAQADLYDFIRDQPTIDQVVIDEGDVAGGFSAATQTLRARYEWPYQAHASMGPSCAVADVQEDAVTVWSSTQDVYALRGALAELLGMDPAQIRVIFVEGAGCYGHNGFDDAAADAVLLSQAIGRPVRVQWMREDEFGWEPMGPAMVIEVDGGLDASGNVAAWDYHVWTPPHNTRPDHRAANLLAGKLVEPPFTIGLDGFNAGSRNAVTEYNFANQRVTRHELTESPIRTSALRTLGGIMNTFANESFMDELAAAAGIDPVAFRLAFLDPNDPSDARAIGVINAVAARYGWDPRPSPQSPLGSGVVTGRGIAFGRYENTGAYVATIAEVKTDTATGNVTVRKVVVAHDCGLIINPIGLMAQIEGNVIHSLGRTLKEELLFDRNAVTSLSWGSAQFNPGGYHVMRFNDIPEIEIVVVEDPFDPALGAGEPASIPTAAAIANAIFDATGARVRRVPFISATVLAAVSGR